MGIDDVIWDDLTEAETVAIARALDALTEQKARLWRCDEGIKRLEWALREAKEDAKELTWRMVVAEAECENTRAECFRRAAARKAGGTK